MADIDENMSKEVITEKETSDQVSKLPVHDVINQHKRHHSSGSDGRRTPIPRERLLSRKDSECSTDSGFEGLEHIEPLDFEDMRMYTANEEDEDR